MKMQRSIPLKKAKHFPILGWGVLIFGILLSFISSIKDYQALELQQKLSLESEILSIQLKIKNKLESYENNLLQTRAFLMNNDKITREQFHKYTQEIQMVEKFPGIQGLTYTEKISSRNLKSHIAEIQKSGIKGYKIWPETPRDTYYSIIYLEPFNWRNQRAIGFDMFTEAVRREAMEKARDTGLPKITRKLFLVQETENDRQWGLILFLPIYKPGADVSTKKLRQKYIIGFVSSVFRAKDLFNSIFADSKLNVDFEIFDSMTIGDDHLLYDYNNIPQFYKKKFRPTLLKTKLFEFSGQTFTILINPEALFQKERRHSYLWIFFGGILVTVLMTWILVTTKRQTEDLLETQKALREAVVMRDEFLSIASHELRTPMTTLNLQSQMLKKSISKSVDLNIHREKIEKVMNQIIKQVTSLNRLVEDMLDIARLRTGNLKIEVSDINLADIIHESVNNLSEQMTLSGYPPPEIEISGNLNGRWDKMRIGQVITNILTNAIRYGKKKPIKIKAEELISTVRVSITDQGQGVSEEDIERIFGRFERATSSNESTGLGLGLFISKQIITAHKGKIWVDSKLNVGSTFCFEIPKN
jgi:two-component system OmpR family sensor kinase